MITRDHQIVVAVRYEDGLGNASQVVGCRLATAHDCFELGDSCLHRNARVTIDCSFGESREIVIGGAFSLVGAWEEQEVSGVVTREGGFEVGEPDDLAHLVNPAGTARSGAGQHNSPDQSRVVQGDHLGDCTAEGEPDQVDGAMAEGANERSRILAHLFEVCRYRGVGCSYASVVERDDVVILGDSVDDARIPVVEDGGEVVQEHHGHASRGAEFAVCILHAVRVHGFRPDGFPRGRVGRCVVACRQVCPSEVVSVARERSLYITVILLWS